MGKFTAVIFSSPSGAEGAAVTLLWLLINITHVLRLTLYFPYRGRGEATAGTMEHRLQPELPRHWEGWSAQKRANSGGSNAQRLGWMEQPVGYHSFIQQVFNGCLVCARLYLCQVLSVTDVNCTHWSPGARWT